MFIDSVHQALQVPSAHDLIEYGIIGIGSFVSSKMVIARFRGTAGCDPVSQSIKEVAEKSEKRAEKLDSRVQNVEQSQIESNAISTERWEEQRRENKKTSESFVELRGDVKEGNDRVMQVLISNRGENR